MRCQNGKPDCECLLEMLKNKLSWVEDVRLEEGVLVVERSYPVGEEIVRAWARLLAKELAGKVHELRIEKIEWMN